MNNYYIYIHINKITGKVYVGQTCKNAGNKKQVRCIETQQIFETVTEASKWCQDGKTTLKSHIAEQIQGKRKSCGKHPVTGESLHWEYVFNKGEQNNEN